MSDAPAPSGSDPLDPFQRLSDLIARRLDHFANRLAKFGDRTAHALLNPHRQPHLYLLVEADGADEVVGRDLNELTTNPTPGSSVEFDEALLRAAESVAIAGLHPDETEPVFGAIRDRYHALQLVIIMPPSAERNYTGARRAESPCLVSSLFGNEVRHFQPLLDDLAAFAARVEPEPGGAGGPPWE